MNPATQNERQASDRDAARRWVARQLAWERTLDVLRGNDPLEAERPATEDQAA